MDESEFGTTIIVLDPATDDPWWQTDCGWATVYRDFVIEHVGGEYWHVNRLGRSCDTYGQALEMINNSFED